jgi:hypothetical protein
MKLRPAPLSSETASTRLVISATWQSVLRQTAVRHDRWARAKSNATTPTSTPTIARILSQKIVSGYEFIAPS